MLLLHNFSSFYKHIIYFTSFILEYFAQQIHILSFLYKVCTSFTVYNLLFLVDFNKLRIYTDLFIFCFYNFGFNILNKSLQLIEYILQMNNFFLNVLYNAYRLIQRIEIIIFKVLKLFF